MIYFSDSVDQCNNPIYMYEKLMVAIMRQKQISCLSKYCEIFYWGKNIPTLTANYIKITHYI
jgi:hypothetical protein